MGQYWIPVNLDKKEYIQPQALGAGLKIEEQIAAHPGTGTAIMILCAAVGTKSQDLSAPSDTNIDTESEEYSDIAKRTIGRWAGDRIAFIGDYATDDILPNSPIPASTIHKDLPNWKDITEDVSIVIERILHGKYTGTGIRRFIYEEDF